MTRTQVASLALPAGRAQTLAGARVALRAVLTRAPQLAVPPIHAGWAG